nr:Fic family protein [Duganella violaceicalia]
MHEFWVLTNIMRDINSSSVTTVYAVPSLNLPWALRFTAAELQRQRKAQKCVVAAVDDLDARLLHTIAQGSILGRRYGALARLDHVLSEHAMRMRGDDMAFKAAEAGRKYMLEKQAYRRHCSALWAALHADDSAVFLQALLSTGSELDEFATSFRTVPMGTIPDSKGRCRAFPNASEVTLGLKQLWEFENKSVALNPIVRAAVFHYAICVLHPFRDGNGRLARVLFNVLLNRGNVEKSYVPCRQLFNASRFGYEIRLHQLDSEQDWNALIDFFCDVVVAGYRMRKKSLKRRTTPVKERYG